MDDSITISKNQWILLQSQLNELLLSVANRTKECRDEPGDSGAEISQVAVKLSKQDKKRMAELIQNIPKYDGHVESSFKRWEHNVIGFCKTFNLFFLLSHTWANYY